MEEFRIKNMFKNYLRHQDINDYLDYLGKKYPKLTNVLIIGYSYEGRPLKSIKISLQQGDTNELKSINKSHKKLGGSRVKKKLNKEYQIGKSKLENSTEKLNRFYTINGENIEHKNIIESKSIVLIDGGLHAREWLSISTAIYCIYQLTEMYTNNLHLLKQLDFYIIPLINVDGYEYSHTNNRNWRKTRKPIQGCKHIGTDCNRNFSVNWDNACNKPSRITFRGLEPFSEPETLCLRNVMHSLQPNCKFYLSLHSYSKSIMYPWGYTKKLPENWKKLHRLAEIGSRAIFDKTQKKYRYGNVAHLTHQCISGGSPDYAMQCAKIPYAMVMELAGGEFHPPNHEILHLVKESWIGIRAMCKYIENI